MFEPSRASALVDEMTTAARMESTVIAKRLKAVSDLYVLRREDYAEAEMWATDVVEATAAEVSAAQNISRHRAASQVRLAALLFERLPKVAEVFGRGEIDMRVVRLAMSRTDNVDDEIIGSLDASLAEHIGRWMRFSNNKLRDRIDLWVAKHDPAAIRVPPAAKENRYFEIDPHVPGMAFVGGVLDAMDAAGLDRRLDAMADSVCPNDPRTKRQRRADACGALGRLETRLACQCEQENCPSSPVDKGAVQVVIHVLAEQKTIDGSGNQPGYLPGLGLLPAETVRECVAGAKRREVSIPGPQPESGYRPSTSLTDYLRWRDLTCRFPGCDAPVAVCDIDHTNPWPVGPTHASGLKHYCRTHHLIKTFFTGATGWAEVQHPDGSIVLTAPTGHTYRTEAHGGILFPTLAQPTSPLRHKVSTPPSATRSLMMPRRRQTRAADRQDRIERERGQRLEINAEIERQRQAWLRSVYKPPPF